MKTLIATSCALMLLSGAAFAQNSNSSQSNSSSSSSMSGTNNTPIREQVKDNLQKAGFQDVSVTPASFLVRAKDKSGRPVAMVMTPDSVMMVTEMPVAGGSDGTASSSGQSSSKP